MWYIFVLMVCTFIVSFLFSPVTKVIANKCGAIDLPDGIRKKHTEPTPRLGGMAIVISFVLVCMVGVLISQGKISNNVLIICMCTMLICLFGIIDDIYSLPAWVKFIGEIIIATIATIWGGAIEYIYVFDSFISLGVFSIPLTILWYVLLTNAINLLDGLDGLACSITSIISLAIFVVSILKGNIEAALITATLLGASIGFLPFNLSKNKIFMGDCGALSYGFILAGVSTLEMFKSATVISALTPAIIFALPLFDLLSVFVTRTVDGKNPFKGDRRHIQFKLVDLGISNTATVIIIMIATTIYCASAVVSLYSKIVSIVVTIVLSLILVLLKHGKDWFGITTKENTEENVEENTEENIVEKTEENQ